MHEFLFGGAVATCGPCYSSDLSLFSDFIFAGQVSDDQQALEDATLLDDPDECDLSDIAVPSTHDLDPGLLKDNERATLIAHVTDTVAKVTQLAGDNLLDKKNEKT